MTRLIRGPRIARSATIRPGCSATLFSPDRTRVLLTRRSDNHLWCLPGGGVDPGEAVAETCEREVLEETGLHVRVTRLLGVYSDPDLIVEYRDGNRFQILALNFEVELLAGEPGLSDETEAVGYYSIQEMDTLDLMEHHRQRILDAFANHTAAFVR